MNPTFTAQEVERVSDERLEVYANFSDSTYAIHRDVKTMARELQRLRAASVFWPCKDGGDHASCAQYKTVHCACHRLPSEAQGKDVK